MQVVTQVSDMSPAVEQPCKPGKTRAWQAGAFTVHAAYLHAAVERTF